MSTLNIAIAGGVVLLILVLLKLRRAGADEPKAPGRGKGRVRGERRRRRGKDAPPAPPEPMPLAAAAGESAATAEADHFVPPAAEWPPADEPAPAPWPPAAEEEPVEWPDAEAPAAPEPYAVEDEEPAAAAPAPAPEAHVWAEDEIVTEPGWPMPGEVDVAWSPPSTVEAVPVVPAAAAGPAWQEEAATAAPERFEWLGEAEEEDEGIPAWDPAPAETPAAPESSAWSAPEEAAPAWEAPADEPSPWDQAGEPVEDAQPTGPIPVAAEAVQAFEPAEAFAPVEDFEPEAFAPVDDFEPETFAPVEDFEPEAFAPAEAFAPVQAFEPAEAFPPVAGFDPAEAVAEVEPFAPEALEAPFSAPESFEDEAAEFDLPAFVPGPRAGDAPLRAEDGLPVEPVAAAPVTAPAADAPAWWDEVEEPGPVAVEAPAAVADDPARTGRFALGGFAVQPGQQALGGVSFRAEIADAPTTWTVSGDGEDGVSDGTIVLQLDGAINCTPDDIEVVMEPGFAPTTQGFTVRVAALAPGPFAASGTFRVR